MPLWDALSGKIWYWNQRQREANDRVCKVLKVFVSSRLARYPNGAEMFTHGRGALYGYFLGAQTFISAHIDNVLVTYKHRIYGLNVHSYLSLLCALHMQHLFGVQCARNWPTEEESWFYLLTEGAGDIYGRPPAYVIQWYEKLDWFKDPESGRARIAFKAYDEIAPVVGLPESNLQQCLIWGAVSLDIAHHAKRFYCDLPNWRTLVEQELVEH